MKRYILSFLLFALPVLIVSDYFLNGFYSGVPYFAQFVIHIVIIAGMTEIGILILNRYYKK